MDLSERLLELLGGARPGDRVGDAVLRRASSELGLCLDFEVRGRPVSIEVALPEGGRRYAVKTARLAVSYRTGDGERAVEPAVGLALCRDVATIVARHEEAVLADMAREAAAATARDEGGSRIREITGAKLLAPAGPPEAPHYTLTPYVGCLIGCRFCYAQSRVADARRLASLPEIAWGSYVDVRVDAPDVLRRELATLPPRPIKFCPIVSDPYQAVETHRRVTRACLEVIAASPGAWPTLVLTRARLVERDADVLASIAAGGYAGVSLPTVDDDVRAHFEPRAATIAERLAVLKNLRAAGVRTFAVVQPLLPGSIEALADALAACVDSVTIDVLHGVEGAANDFADPRYGGARDPAWQRARADELRALATARGVAVWDGDLPPELRLGGS